MSPHVFIPKVEGGGRVRVEEIEIRTDHHLGRPYKELGHIEARVTAGAAWNRARTVEDVNSKLREVALGMGANAVIDVTYARGVSATSWKALTATGIAVVARSAERTCPHCAEEIKREAKVCRYCGRDVEPLDFPSEGSDIELVREDYPGLFERAIECLQALPRAPDDPGAWVRELCRRMEAGSPPDAAASRIALDWQA